MRGVTKSLKGDVDLIDISTHTPHARRDTQKMGTGTNVQISTHTPHARRDNLPKVDYSSVNNFYSHASCEA